MNCPRCGGNLAPNDYHDPEAMGCLQCGHVAYAATSVALAEPPPRPQQDVDEHGEINDLLPVEVHAENIKVSREQSKRDKLIELRDRAVAAMTEAGFDAETTANYLGINTSAFYGSRTNARRHDITPPAYFRQPVALTAQRAVFRLAQAGFDYDLIEAEVGISRRHVAVLVARESERRSYGP